MAITIPNLDRIQKQAPPLGEALQKIQVYVNNNVSPATGNKVTAPTFIVPGARQG
jgi:hypothetical protein